MRKNRKGRPLPWILLLAVIAGTLAWELLAKTIALTADMPDLSAGPIGFDLYAISVYVRFNPGSIAGFIAGLVISRGL